MKKILLILLSGLLFAACAPKEAQFSMLEEQPCKEEHEIKTSGEFVAMTVDNLIVDHQNEKIFVTFDVRAYCNSDLDLKLREKELSSEVVIQLMNKNNQTDDCVCSKRLRAELFDLAPGTYSLKIMDESSQTLYASRSITYNLPE
jgi:hypothetical protein